MNSLSEALDLFIQGTQQNLFFLLAIIAFLLIIHLINKLLGDRLLYLGIYPRSLIGLQGILFAPLLRIHKQLIE